MNQLCDAYLLHEKIDHGSWKLIIDKLVASQKLTTGSYKQITEKFGEQVAKLCFLIHRSNDHNEPSSTQLKIEDSLPAALIEEVNLETHPILVDSYPLVLIKKENDGNVRSGIRCCHSNTL